MCRTLFIAAVLLVTCAATVQAKPQADPLGACLTDNTTGRDRKDIAKWLFLAIAAHPEVREFAADGVEAAAMESAKTMGALVTRLLTDACSKEAKDALKTGGSNAFEIAFQRLGVVAMQELTSDEAVRASIGLFERFIDQNRIKEAIGQDGRPMR